MIEGLTSDPGAEYAHVIELDASEITPMVATPGDPGNGKFVRDLNTPVPVEIAYGGTCTAGKNEDMDMYAQVLADSLKQGKRVADSVRFYIQFGSQETREYCMRKGYVEIFRKAGAHVIEPSCGAIGGIYVTGAPSCWFRRCTSACEAGESASPATTTPRFARRSRQMV